MSDAQQLGSQIVEFDGGEQTSDVAIAADGSVFFVDARRALGRIGEDGRVSLYRLPQGARQAGHVTVGSDGNLWITEWSNPEPAGNDDRRVSTVTLDGLLYDYVSVRQFGTPRQIVDIGDALYFAVGSGLGRLSPAEGSVTYFPFPVETAWSSFEATAVVYDGRGIIWLGLSGYLAKFSITNETWDLVQIGDCSITECVLDIEQTLWFTSFPHSKVGRLRADGDLRIWGHEGNPYGIALASDGGLWITEFAANRLTEIDRATGAVLRGIDLPQPDSQPTALAADHSGRLWFAEQVGRVGCFGPNLPSRQRASISVADIAPPSRRLVDIVPNHAPSPVNATPNPVTVPARFTEHPSFVPPGPETPIWRYIDMPKLVAMLEAEAIFFARLDTQPDRFEGSLLLRDLGDIATDKVGLAPDHARHKREALALFRPLALISCWHISEFESVAMWDLYARGGSGIAIRSSAARLVASINKAGTVGGGIGEPNEPVGAFLGVVKYANYESDVLLPATALDYLTLKRASFQHERELRAVILSRNPMPGGQNVKCDLDVLIDQIYVSPASPAWLRDAVQAVLDHYGFDRVAQQSDLDRDPLL